MNAPRFIVTQIHEDLRPQTLYNDSMPSWDDKQYIRGCSIRLRQDDASAWPDFLQRLEDDLDLASYIRSMMIDRFLLLEDWGFEKAGYSRSLNLPPEVEPLSVQDTRRFLQSLEAKERDDHSLYPHSWASYFLDRPEIPQVLYARREFTKPAKKTPGQIMYIEMKPGLSGPARIGRVRSSKSGKTLYYGSRTFQSLKGGGYKANYYDVETSLWYWVSKVRKDGNDALYPATIEIDDDVR